MAGELSMMKDAKTWDELRAELPARDRAAIEARATELKKATVLAELRETAMKKQSEVTGMTQYGVSRLESRKDWLVSSLNAYVRGMGGTLKLVANLPGVGDVELPLDAQGELRHTTKSRPVVRKAPAASRTTKLR
jgi:hypothetical protein